ncbi:hypothetical protein ACN9MN_13410 [Chryseobacterium sp. S-02]|uniref:hypothetical protein n=1 Tax=Chryseobacterium sp. S-02 TaxID=3404064 RepID=UPI003CE909AC
MLAIDDFLKIIWRTFLIIASNDDVSNMLKYKVLAFIIIVVYFFQPFFIANGGIGADSLSYFGIAADLPFPETNLFPLGYPVLLRIMYEFCNDYFLASRILSFLFTGIILGFSYYKKFYFRETVLLFTGKTLFFVFIQTMSEGPFIFFMYFLFYFLHEIFMREERKYINALCASLMLICMFLTRYSGVYVLLGFIIAFGVIFNRVKNTNCFKPLLFCIVMSGLGIAGYLLFNYLYFGSVVGENERGLPSNGFSIYTIRNVLGLFNLVNPFVGLKPASISLPSMIFQFLIFVLDVAIAVYFFKYYKKAKEEQIAFFHIILWTVALVYGVCLWVSGWFQQIEEMNVRMMAAANICVFFSFLILYFENSDSDKWLWRIACLFFVFHTLYNLKDHGDFLKNRKIIKSQMSKFNDKKYLFNDEENWVTMTTYDIPVIHKSFKYKHTNSQKGSLKENIAGSVNPKIKWLLNDTVRDKSKVLYTSQLKLK